jgi:death-on-curing protein
MKNKYIISFVSVADVHEMHDLVIQQLGGHAGVYNEGLLESAVNQPLMILSYGSTEQQDITYLAATYFCHIIKNHPFVDGNKRTGLLTALKFLAKNGYEIEVSAATIYDDLYQLAIDTAASKKSKEEISAFFKALIMGKM